MASHEPRLAKPSSGTAMPHSVTAPSVVPKGPVEVRDAVTIRFAGDAGDGMQLVGTQFTMASAIHGNAVCTMPDHPAEIRAPVGTLAGVSGFQVHFSKHAIHTPGDRLNALVAMNPAALKANVSALEPKGLLILNTDAFTPDDLAKAGYSANPLQDGSLNSFRVLPMPMDQFVRIIAALTDGLLIAHFQNPEDFDEALIVSAFEALAGPAEPSGS